MTHYIRQYLVHHRSVTSLSSLTFSTTWDFASHNTNHNLPAHREEVKRCWFSAVSHISYTSSMTDNGDSLITFSRNSSSGFAASSSPLQSRSPRPGTQKSKAKAKIAKECWRYSKIHKNTKEPDSTEFLPFLAKCLLLSVPLQQKLQYTLYCIPLYVYFLVESGLHSHPFC